MRFFSLDLAKRIKNGTKSLFMSSLELGLDTGLYMAVTNGHLLRTKLFLKLGANPNQIIGFYSILYRECYKGSFVLYNKEKRDAKIAEQLVKYGADINYRNPATKETPLMVAIRSRNFETAKMLIDNNADVNVVDRYKDSPLLIAVKANSTEVVKKLIEKGADVNFVSKFGKGLLHYATEVSERNWDIINALIDSGLDVKVEGRKALEKACIDGKLDVVKKLLDKGLDVNYTDKTGKSMLMHACENGNLEIVKELIARGAKIDITDNDKKSALMFACRKGNLDIVKLLVKNGADVNKKGPKYYGETPIMELFNNDIESSKRVAIIKYLLDECKVDVNYVSDNKNTVLLKAIDESDYASVKELLEHNADVNLDKRGKGVFSALGEADNHIFERNKKIDEARKIEEILVEYGADTRYLNFCVPIGRKKDIRKEPIAKTIFAIEKKDGFKEFSENLNKYYDRIKNIGNKSKSIKLFEEKLDGLERAKEYAKTLRLKLKEKEKKPEVKEVVVDEDLERIYKKYKKGKQKEDADFSFRDKLFRRTCERGDYKGVKELILQGVNINAKDASGRTALAYALRSGNLDIVKLLVNLGADTNNRDMFGETPIMILFNGDKYIPKSAKLEIIKYLGQETDANLNIMAKNGESVLSKAVEKCDRDSVKELIKQGADINLSAKNNTYDTLLRIVSDLYVRSGRKKVINYDALEMAKMLVCYGIDLKRFQNVEFEGTELLIDEPMVRVRLALGAEKEIKKANDFYEKNIKDHPNDKELKKLHINSKELKIIAQKNFTDGLNKYLKQLKKIRGKTVVNLEYKIEQFEYAKEYIKNMKKELENSDFENKVKEIFIKNVKEFEKNINIEYEKNIDLYNRHKSKAPREERIVEIFEEKELNKQKQVLEEFDRNVKLDYAKTVALYGEYKHPNKKLKGIKKILNRLSVRSLFGRRYKKKQPKLSKDELKKLEIKPKNVTKQKEEHKI